ncbi:MAG: diguanylate cyclase [Magnetococcales bacterium]|nr:diguanylate cyclase [Magnetococcales bacterium]
MGNFLKNLSGSHVRVLVLGGLALFLSSSLVNLALFLETHLVPSFFWIVGIAGSIGGAASFLLGLFFLEKNAIKYNEVKEFCDNLTAAYVRLDTQLKTSQTLPLFVRDAIVACDEQGLINFWNQSAAELFGLSESDAMGKPVDMLMPKRYREAHRRQFEIARSKQNALTGGRILEFSALRRDGHEIPIEMSLSGWRTRGEQFFVAVIRDITSRKIVEASSERVQQSRVAISELLQIALEPITLEEQLEQALRVILSVPWLTIESKGSIFLFDEETQELVMAVERNLSKPLLTACARLPLGYCLCGRAAQAREIIYSNDLDKRHDVTFDGIRPHGHYCVPIVSQSRLLGVINMYLPQHHIQDPEEIDFLWAIANTLAGVIERKSVEDRLAHLAHHDTLTGLPNRKLFLDRLHHDLARAKRTNTLLGIMFLDLDKFKEVNDTLGHEIGDLLLIEVSRRLKKCLRESDTVARMGGDEFVIILTVLPKPDGATKVAEKIVETLQKPFDLLGKQCHIGVSIGISYNTMHGNDPETLLQKADAAMYAVKRSGRNNFRVFNDSVEVAQK